VRDVQAAGGAAITSSEPLRVGRYRLVAVVVGVLGLALDQAVKALAIATLDPAHPIPLLGGLVTLQLIRNSGAAFSMGEGITPVFTVLAIVALVGVLAWAVPRVRHLGWAVTAGLLVAGISGNLTDRLFREPGPFRGHVVDFIQVPYFAIFNVADIFITAAAVLVVWLTMIAKVNLDGTRPVDHAEAADG
jgi:signal peptidase II